MGPAFAELLLIGVAVGLVIIGIMLKVRKSLEDFKNREVQRIKDETREYRERTDELRRRLSEVRFPTPTEESFSGDQQLDPAALPGNYYDQGSTSMHFVASTGYPLPEFVAEFDSLVTTAESGYIPRPRRVEQPRTMEEIEEELDTLTEKEPFYARLHKRKLRRTKDD